MTGIYKEYSRNVPYPPPLELNISQFAIQVTKQRQNNFSVLADLLNNNYGLTLGNSPTCTYIYTSWPACREAQMCLVCRFQILFYTNHVIPMIAHV